MDGGVVPDMERIIESVERGDQDTVQLLLDSYNTQYAECFFFDSEAQDRKKQQRLEQFRLNKVRDCAADSDSDSDPEDDKPDLLLRQHLAASLLSFINTQLQPAVLRACLHTLRILSRDRRALAPMVTDDALLTFAHLGGLSLLQECPQLSREGPAGHQSAGGRGLTHGGAAASDCEEPAQSSSANISCTATTNSSTPHCHPQTGEGGGVVLPCGKRDTWKEGSEQEAEEDGEACRKEAIKVLCNIIYNSPRAQERASTLRLLQGLWESLKQGMWSRAPSSGQFFKLRLLFLLTALRPELRLQMHQARGMSVLTKALEQRLAVRCAEGYEMLSDTAAAPTVSKELSQEVIEILKTLFNIAHVSHRQDPDEEGAALYRHLAAVLRHCLLLSCDEEDTQEELQGHTVNILSIMPLTCLDVLLAVPVDQATHACGGVNMDCVHTLLLFMERGLNRSQKLKEKLTPVLNLLTESSRVHRETRRYLRQKVLPPLRDVAVRPEQDGTLRGQLVRLMTHLDMDVKHCAAELLFVLCKENVSRFVKYTGYGNAAGLLAARRLLHGGRGAAHPPTASNYSSDSDSDTEEYREAKGRINLVTGRVEAEQPDPMEGMTEEEKEEEARRLICMINRLSREQIIQPLGVTVEGRLCPLWGQMRDCTLQEEEEEEGEEEEEEEEEECN